ncbi:hypothetical protein GOBAR_DD09848 [Gossypium barbadense]|nr:hypothetical protein GOBAR_DD09848 [Gossypium barbadense]
MADQSSNPSIILPKPPHPLHQIAETPTHRLLLKQWLKEEELILNRISFKETQIDSVRHLEKLLEREKEDGKLLGKCVEELKKKGVEFDLLKEVDALRRAKSLRVEAKAVRKWSARDFVTLFFFTVSCLLAEKIDVGFCHRKGRKLVFGNGIGSNCRIFSSAFVIWESYISRL